MIFRETSLRGAYLIELEPRHDERGFFARAFCEREFELHGLVSRISQVNFSTTRTKGTVRGMHFQNSSAPEAKFVRCVRGAILDVIIDLRPESDTYLQHYSVELTDDNFRALYVPERFAHGLQTLRDNTDILYHTSVPYTAAAEGGLHYNDPQLGLQWPLPATVISEKDNALPKLAAIDNLIDLMRVTDTPVDPLSQAASD